MPDPTIHQIGRGTFEIDAPLSDALVLVESVLSRVEKIVVTPATGSRIDGEYKFGTGDLLVAFAFVLTERGAHATQAELQFDGNEPAYRTDMIRNALGNALCEAYDPQWPARGATNDDLSSRPNHSRPYGNTPASPREPTIPSSDYKTTSAVGSFMAIIGWIGVALSLLGGLVAVDALGFAGIAAGFIAAFFCLLTVAAGQLLRAQVEIANNSRLIVLHLDQIGRGSS